MQATWGKSISYGSISERNSEAEKSKLPAKKINLAILLQGVIERERKKREKKVLIRWLILKLSGCIIDSMQASSGSTDVDLIYLVHDLI